jgi:hypothetical protein
MRRLILRTKINYFARVTAGESPAERYAAS